MIYLYFSVNKNPVEKIKIEKPIEIVTVKKIEVPSTSKAQPIVENEKPKTKTVEPTKPVVMKDVIKNTWTCSACTLINSLWSPLCSACGSKKTNPVVENKKDHYTELLKLDNKDLIHNEEQFECPVCFTECKSHEGVVLRECLHSFCKECLQSVVKYCEEADIKCPYRDKNYSCDSSIQEREIKGLVDKPTYEKHLAKSVAFAENKMKNTFHCKTANCKGWCIYEENVNDFLCPVCKKRNCLTCQVGF